MITLPRLLAGLTLAAGCLPALPAFPAAAPGVTDNEIVLGQSTALSGPPGQLGRDTVTGSKAYFGYINAHGGINGRNLTRERLIETLETMGRIDYDGYAIHYTKNSHLAVPYVELTMISRDGRFLR